MLQSNTEMKSENIDNFLEMEIHSNDKYDSNMIDGDIHYTSWSPMSLGYKFVEDFEHNEDLEPQIITAEDLQHLQISKNMNRIVKALIQVEK